MLEAASQHPAPASLSLDSKGLRFTFPVTPQAGADSELSDALEDIPGGFTQHLSIPLLSVSSNLLYMWTLHCPLSVRCEGTFSPCLPTTWA